MEQFLMEIVKQSPLVAILVWLVYRFQGSIETKDKQIIEMQSKLIDVVQHNTQAITESKAIIRENTKATEALSSRIYDVLVDRNKK